MPRKLLLPLKPCSSWKMDIWAVLPVLYLLWGTDFLHFLQLVWPTFGNKIGHFKALHHNGLRATKTECLMYANVVWAGHMRWCILVPPLWGWWRGVCWAAQMTQTGTPYLVVATILPPVPLILDTLWPLTSPVMSFTRLAHKCPSLPRLPFQLWQQFSESPAVCLWNRQAPNLLEQRLSSSLLLTPGFLYLWTPTSLGAVATQWRCQTW